MCVCVRMHVCGCIDVYGCVLHAYVHSVWCVCVHVHVHVCACVVCVHVRVCVCVCVCV